MADLSDDPEDVVTYYRKILEGYDCVFGSRFIKGSKVKHYPKLKLVVNRIVNRCIQVMFWTRFNDLTNAFKAYRTEVIRDCGPYQASHFNLTLEMSLGALIRNYNIVQVPNSWYGPDLGQLQPADGRDGPALPQHAADDVLRTPSGRGRPDRRAAREPERRFRYLDDLDCRLKAIERHLGIDAEPVVPAEPISRLSDTPDPSWLGNAGMRQHTLRPIETRRDDRPVPPWVSRPTPTSD